MEFDDYKGINDYIEGCSEEELLSFSKVLDTVSQDQQILIIEALSYSSRVILNMIDIENL